MSHKCHHPHCSTEVPPRLFACKKHWFALPKKFRDDLWATYRKGQEVDKRPSGDYLRAVSVAIHWWMNFSRPADAK